MLNLLWSEFSMRQHQQLHCQQSTTSIRIHFSLVINHQYTHSHYGPLINQMTSIYPTPYKEQSAMRNKSLITRTGWDIKWRLSLLTCKEKWSSNSRNWNQNLNSLLTNGREKRYLFYSVSFSVVGFIAFSWIYNWK